MAKTKSRNALLNFIVGNRGGGKTFGFLDWCIARWLKTRNTPEPEQFIYARRYMPELKPLAISQNGTLFAKVAKVKYQSHTFRADSGKLWIDGELAGYAVTVSQMSSLKSVDFSQVHVIGLDEFILPKGKLHYVTGQMEPEILLDFYQTVDRDEDRVSMWFMANAITNNNPYFNYFGLYVPKPGRIRLFGEDKNILVENVADQELIEKKKSTRMGRLIEGTNYGDYAIENKMLLDTETFLRKKPETCGFKFTLIYLDQELGIWFDFRNSCYYVSMDIDRQNPLVFAATTEDMQPNVMLLRGARKNPYIDNLMKAYNLGRVYFESGKLKAWFQEIARIL